MTLTEQYLYLFSDSFMVMLIFPIRTPFVLPVMLSFGAKNLLVLWGISVCGGVSALAVNFLFGKLLTHALSRESLERRRESLSQWRRLFNMLGVPVLALTGWMPAFGGFLTVCAGFVQMRPGLFMVAALIGQAGYWAYRIIQG